MQEKIDYVNQMPAEERSNYLSNLTPEERNSFIKQLPLNDKADVLNEFLGVGDSLGLHFTVDEMTNDTVVVSARDKNGKLIDVSGYGRDSGGNREILYTADYHCSLAGWRWCERDSGTGLLCRQKKTE